jgi:hypothetical protein
MRISGRISKNCTTGRVGQGLPTGPADGSFAAEVLASSRRPATKNSVVNGARVRRSAGPFRSSSPTASAAKTAARSSLPSRDRRRTGGSFCRPLPRRTGCEIPWSIESLPIPRGRTGPLPAVHRRPTGDDDKKTVSFSRRQKDKNPKIERKPLPVQGLNFAAPAGTEFGRNGKTPHLAPSSRGQYPPPIRTSPEDSSYA